MTSLPVSAKPKAVFSGQTVVDKSILLY